MTYYSSDKAIQLTQQDVIRRRLRIAARDRRYWFRVYRDWWYHLSPVRAALAALRNRETAFDVM